MNHALAIVATPALIYSMHQVSVVWIIVAHFHLCSLLGMLSRYTILEVWAVRRPMRACCGRWWGRCVLFVNILDSLTPPCLVYNTAMYTVYGRCGQYGRCMVHTLAGVPGAAGAWFIRTSKMCWHRSILGRNCPDTSALVRKCLLDTSAAIVPMCLGAKVSWDRSVW